MSEKWLKVCTADDLVINSGVCALVEDKQVALFSVAQSSSPQIFAVGNWDPLGKANVMYRGLLGSVEDKVVVASPLYKQRYCLNTGQCLEDPAASLPVFETRLNGQDVELKVAV